MAAPETDGRSIRTLFVSDERGWPPISGYRRRTSQILSTLARLGPVTWVVAPRSRFDDGGPLDVPPGLRAGIDARLVPAVTRSRATTARRWATTRLPWPLAAGDWSSVEQELSRLRAEPFDLVWSMGLDALLSIERAGVGAPAMMVDADLESLKLARRLELGPPMSPARTTMARADTGRWERLERSAARRLTGFSVCSGEERDRLGGTAFVTPNSYPAVEPTGHAGPGTPILLFVGSLGYEPNRDAVAWFADTVLPTVRWRHPDAVLRVVGSGPGIEPSLGRSPGVELVGSVADIGAELGAAAAVVVPVRWGAGTRVKILEAMAHRVPVITTSIGAEGLGLTNGRELLVADDAVAMADTCSRVLGGMPELAGLVQRAHDVFGARFESSVVSHGLEREIRARLVGRVAGGST